MRNALDLTAGWTVIAFALGSVWARIGHTRKRRSNNQP